MRVAFWRSPVFVLICAVGIIFYLPMGGRWGHGNVSTASDGRAGLGCRISELCPSQTGLQLLIYGCAAPFWRRS